MTKDRWVYVHCNLCGKDDWDVRLPATVPLFKNGHLDVRAYQCTSASYGQHPQIVQCRHCSYIYANPRRTTQTILEAYANVEDQTYVVERQGRELTFRKHLQAMEKRLGKANQRRLLDVGAYIGVFIEVARQAGWDAWGLEPSQWAVQEARSRHLPMIEGTLTAPELQGQKFDVITMWDVIEHLSDPAGELARCFQLLKPGGVIIAHTMDIGSLTARLMGQRWPWLMEMHIHYFTSQTLRKMMEKQGFEVIWSGTEGRYLRLGYLASRVTGLNKWLGYAIERGVKRLGWGEVAVPVNFGDLFTIYAHRP